MRYLYLFLIIACGTLRAQPPNAVTSDPTPDTKTPSQNIETVIPLQGSHLMGMFMLAAGAEAHRTIILLHGFPGYEQNIDLAQTLRRAGWNVLALHYRGTWGSQGSFSFTHCMEDVGTMLAYVTEPANAVRFHVNTRRIVVIGHSMGGFLSVAAMAQHPEFVAGVVISEGSPVDDAAQFFGGGTNPADYAPLAGTSATALQREAKANDSGWRFKALAPKIAPRPLLVFSANDGLRPGNEALTAALKQAGCAVTYLHMNTDHGFSDHRIALQTAVLHWLDKTVH